MKLNPKPAIMCTAALLALLTVALTPSPPFDGQLVISWSVPGALTSSNNFNLIGSPTLNIPATNWPVIANVSGLTTQAVVNVGAGTPSFYFIVVETNKFGVGPFSAVAPFDLPRGVTVNNLARQNN